LFDFEFNRRDDLCTWVAERLCIYIMITHLVVEVASFDRTPFVTLTKTQM